MSKKNTQTAQAPKTPLFVLKKPIEISISVAVSATLAISATLGITATFALDKIHALNAPVVSVLQLRGKMAQTSDSTPVYQVVRQKDKVSFVKQGSSADVVITCPDTLSLRDCLAIADEQ